MTHSIERAPFHLGAPSRYSAFSLARVSAAVYLSILTTLISVYIKLLSLSALAVHRTNSWEEIESVCWHGTLMKGWCSLIVFEPFYRLAGRSIKNMPIFY